MPVKYRLGLPQRLHLVTGVMQNIRLIDKMKYGSEKRGAQVADFLKDKRGGFGKIGLVLILTFTVFIIYAAYQFFLIPAPVVNGIDAFTYLPEDKTVMLSTENLRSIEISVYQQGEKIDLLKDTTKAEMKSYALTIKPKTLGLTDGKAIVTIKAKAGILKKVQHDIEAVIDTVPPGIEIIAAPAYINSGSAGFSVLKASGEDSVFIKLVDKDQSIKDKAFKAFKISSGTTTSPEMRTGNTYYVFFPAPFDIDEGSLFYAVATDAAGNQSIRALPTRLRMTAQRMSSINISDDFIKRVVAPLLNETNIADPAGAFKKVNEELRQQSLNYLMELSQKTEPEILWEGSFLQMKNSKVMAAYGDRRTYLYNGKPISKSAHLGYDLASYEKAPVEAANTGIVRFAGDLSIYGNTVIIDHGLGLMTLYGHLSTIMVNEGQRVSKGDIIAKTGATGLAGGDHLHFGLLIHGYEVSPLYWWDLHWIRVNVTDFLRG